MACSLQVLRQGELGSAACVYWEYGYSNTMVPSPYFHTQLFPPSQEWMVKGRVLGCGQQYHSHHLSVLPPDSVHCATPSEHIHGG